MAGDGSPGASVGMRHWDVEAERSYVDALLDAVVGEGGGGDGGSVEAALASHPIVIRGLTKSFPGFKGHGVNSDTVSEEHKISQEEGTSYTYLWMDGVETSK